MTTMTHMTLEAALTTIATALERLNKRRGNIMPPHMELLVGMSEDGGWVAQIVADPLPYPVGGWGETTQDAMRDLAHAIKRIDWRTVRGRPDRTR